LRRARRSELEAAMLEHVSDTLPDPSAVGDARGDADLMNRAFVELLDGATSGQGAIERLRQYLGTDEESRQQFRRLEEAAAAGRRASAEIGRVGPEGSAEWYGVSVLPLPSLRGSIVWTLV